MGVLIDTDALMAFGEIGLAGEALSLQTRCEEALKTRREASTKELKAEHEALVLERDELGKELSALEVEGAELQRKDRELDKAESDSAFLLKKLKDQEPKARFALEAEVETHRDKVDEARKQLEEVLRRHLDHSGLVQGWKQKTAKGRGRFVQLNQQIDGVFDQIRMLENGKMPVRRDPETGLMNGVNGRPKSD